MFCTRSCWIEGLRMKSLHILHSWFLPSVFGVLGIYEIWPVPSKWIKTFFPGRMSFKLVLDKESEYLPVQIPQFTERHVEKRIKKDSECFKIRRICGMTGVCAQKLSVCKDTWPWWDQTWKRGMVLPVMPRQESYLVERLGTGMEMTWTNPISVRLP